MSNVQVHESPPVARPRRRRRRRIILSTVGVVAVAAAVLSLYAYLQYAAERELRDAIAEADQLDPGWRFEDIDAARPDIPDAENSAVLVAAADTKIPKTFLAPRADGAPIIVERLPDGPPEQRLDDARLNEVRAELAKADAALPVARNLADRARGRWAVAWSRDLLMGTLVPHLERVRRVTHLLVLNAAAASADGHTDAAVRSCRAALNAGRSTGDEPTGIAQLVRAGCVIDAVRALERVLGQGEASDASLQEMQRLLVDEAGVPSLLIFARAERAMQFQALEVMRTGHYNRAAFRLMPTRLGERFDMQVERVLAHRAEPAYLRHLTAVVEIAKLPSHEQEDRFGKLALPTHKLPMLLEAFAGKGQMDWVKIARRFHRAQATLRCAEAATAAERYRLAEHHWPDDLNALVPRYLAAVPSDAFDGRPLRLRGLPDGIVIYSVGPDRADDGGKLDRKNAEAPNTDIGFQLWDAERRGSAPARD